MSYSESVMKALLNLFILVLILLPTRLSHGQNSASSRATLTDLPGVTIYVEPMAKQMEEKGMTDFVVGVEVERRLKEAGVTILDPEQDEPPVVGSPTLYLTVTAVFDDLVEQCAYSIRLEVTQTIHLERDPHATVEHVPTWSVGGIGVYAKGWREAIIDDVVGYTEEFIEAYFTANPNLRN